MLRSFDYAMHAALLSFIAKRPDAREVVERRGAPVAGRGERGVPGRLRRGGGAGRTAGGGAARPSALLELFVLEKAMYELRYEVDNRPDWVRIPVLGLLGASQDARD